MPQIDEVVIPSTTGLLAGFPQIRNKHGLREPIGELQPPCPGDARRFEQTHSGYSSFLGRDWMKKRVSALNSLSMKQVRVQQLWFSLAKGQAVHQVDGVTVCQPGHSPDHGVLRQAMDIR